jgi:hypothetical protein
VGVKHRSREASLNAIQPRDETVALLSRVINIYYWAKKASRAMAG